MKIFINTSLFRVFYALLFTLAILGSQLAYNLFTGITILLVPFNLLLLIAIGLSTFLSASSFLPQIGKMIDDAPDLSANSKRSTISRISGNILMLAIVLGTCLQGWWFLFILSSLNLLIVSASNLFAKLITDALQEVKKNNPTISWEIPENILNKKD